MPDLDGLGRRFTSRAVAGRAGASTSPSDVRSTTVRLRNPSPVDVVSTAPTDPLT